MTVYIVTHDIRHEGSDIVAVFANRLDAAAFCEGAGFFAPSTVATWEGDYWGDAWEGYTIHEHKVVE